MFVNKYIYITLISVIFSQNFIREYYNQEYEYKNYIVTFQNFGDTDKNQGIAIWSLENDTLTTAGNWFEHLVELKTKGWQVSRAMPSNWTGTKEVTMVYYLEKNKNVN